MVDKKPDHWIFIARREEGDLEEMRRVINLGIWDFISRDGYPKAPQFHNEFKKGDFVLFYLAVTYPNGKTIDGGRSIIGRAELGSPYISNGEYNGEPLECFVFLLKPNTTIHKEIEPLDYKIGSHPGQMVVKISENAYNALKKVVSGIEFVSRLNR